MPDMIRILPLLRLVKLCKKPIVIARSVRDEHLRKRVALSFCSDAEIASESINVLLLNQTNICKTPMELTER